MYTYISIWTHTVHVESKKHLSDVLVVVSRRHLWRHDSHKMIHSQTYTRQKHTRQTLTTFFNKPRYKKIKSKPTTMLVAIVAIHRLRRFQPRLFSAPEMSFQKHMVWKTGTRKWSQFIMPVFGVCVTGVTRLIIRYIRWIISLVGCYEWVLQGW